MTTNDGDELVLSTVNAPYRERIGAEELARCVRTGDLGTWKIHVATFFADVRAGLVLSFARRHDIDLETLARTYQFVRQETCERSLDLEVEFVRLEVVAPDDVRGLAKAG